MTRNLRLVVKTLLGLLSLTALVIAGGLAWLIWREMPLKALPSPDQFRAQLAGAGLCSAHSKASYIREFAPLATIPRSVRDAMVLAEDANFYTRAPYKPGLELPLALVKLAIWGRSSRDQRLPVLSLILAACLDHSSDYCVEGSRPQSICRMIVLHRIERDFAKDLIF
jgi:hypothetical protein